MLVAVLVRPKLERAVRGTQSDAKGSISSARDASDSRRIDLRQSWLQQREQSVPMLVARCGEVRPTLSQAVHAFHTRL